MRSGQAPPSFWKFGWRFNPPSLQKGVVGDGDGCTLWKWLLNCSYNSHRSLISEHLSITGKDLDLLSSNYDKIFLMRDFNVEPHDHFLIDFCDVYNLKNLIKFLHALKIPKEIFRTRVQLKRDYQVFIRWLSLFWKHTFK